MTDDILRTAEIWETGDGGFAVEIAVGRHSLHGDEPVADGGRDSGPAPFDLLVAALGSCTVMTMRWYARRQGWPLVHAEAAVTHEKRDGHDHFIKSVSLTGEALTVEQRSKLLEVAARCPVHKAIAGGATTIETRWQTESAP